MAAELGLSEAERDVIWPPLLHREISSAYGLTEPNAGSDSGGTPTTAELKGDEWILNGRKCFCTNANYAGTVIITAVTDKALGPKGISAFVVDAAAEGVSIAAVEHKMGIRASDTAQLAFDDVKLGPENLLGKEGDGFKIAMSTLDGGRIGIAAQALGITRHTVRSRLRDVFVKTGTTRQAALVERLLASPAFFDSAR